MKIYKLSPRAGDFAGWKYSIYRGDAIIRAADEKAARLEAAKAFGIAAAVKPGEATVAEPWSQTVAVSAVVITDSKFSTEGAAGVLAPKEYTKR
jgi:hypothetical protein